MQEKLMALPQRIHDNGGKDSALYELVDRLREMIEDAAINDRAELPSLKELANSVLQTLIHHGKCVHLYERHGEYRLLAENCTTNGVASFATEVLFGVTFGLAIPFVRHFQWELFEKSKKWTTPEHYTTIEITHTLTISGYYDRVKLQLLFDNEQLVRSWRGQVDNLLAKRPSRAIFLKSLIDAFAA
ncbi:hypothetical protein V7S43_011457 [Phytophthora oleae]|uniref:Uncharacterized protein n=1 Tax=Phytophthora oleae TaxID=2107226 RepID=A0ABD3F9M2_9STRA